MSVLGIFVEMALSLLNDIQGKTFLEPMRLRRTKVKRMISPPVVIASVLIMVLLLHYPSGTHAENRCTKRCCPKRTRLAEDYRALGLPLIANLSNTWEARIGVLKRKDFQYPLILF